MEFYFHRAPPLHHIRTVLIPKWMEFYEAQYSQNSSKIRFNSQRDGILHFGFAVKHSIFSVSIPNGMEFYSTNFAIFLGRKC